MAETMIRHRPFGRRLKAARTVCDLSQVELSEKTEIPLSMIKQYERGRCLPRADRLHKIVSALGITTDDLFEGAA